MLVNDRLGSHWPASLPVSGKSDFRLHSVYDGDSISLRVDVRATRNPQILARIFIINPRGEMSEQKQNSRIVVMGVSGCGKSEIGSRLARRLGVAYVEGDTFHPPENLTKMASGYPLDDSDRQQWLQILTDKIREAAAKFEGLVLSCSSLKRKYRDLLREGDPALVFIYLQGDRELIAERMRGRAHHFMPTSLLDSQFGDLEPPQADEAHVTADIRQPPALLVENVIAALDGLESKRSAA